jgi:para-aminobenzoate synthetase component I
MRRTLRLGDIGPVDLRVLKSQDTFLYRRVADDDRTVLGVGALRTLPHPEFDPSGRVLDWTFGHLTYALRTRLELLSSRHAMMQDLPLEHWFVPRWVLEWRGVELLLHVWPGDEAEGLDFVERLRSTGAMPLSEDSWKGPWDRATDRSAYLESGQYLLQHIQRGDIYEVNFCTTRTARLGAVNVFAAFHRLLDHADAPYAGFYRLGQHHALCMSPERFLAFNDRLVRGQPMKGTRPRSSDAVRDRELMAELAADPKERSENIMALDVMRNDLSRVAAKGSVQVDELCAVRSYPQVHQMISTVSARLKEGVTPMDAVYASFPMASMTGAPKLRAMQLIDEVEDRERGLFSGSLGFFAPDGTGDLNVVIRTILYNDLTGIATLSTGSALTAGCDIEREWDECELKARSVLNAFDHA